MTHPRPSPSTTARTGLRCRETRIETLLRAAAQGDQSAFGRFYEHTSPLVYTCVLRTVPDRPTADTAMVAIYTALWRRAAEFGTSACSAWSWTMSLVAEVMADDARISSPPRRPRPLV